MARAHFPTSPPPPHVRYGCGMPQAADLEAPGKPLMRGDYRDATKAVRRTVKQFGSGNISQGLRSIGVSGPAVAAAG